MAEISSQINQKYEELRNIGHELATLVGREPKFPRKRANTIDEEAPPARRDTDRRISYEPKDIKVSLESNERKVISYEGVERKRSRLIEDEPRRSREDRHDDDSHFRRPTLQSSVRMPTIETKSREEVLAERKSQTGADGARNRRMFGNLLLGTLKQFQKEEKAPDVAPKTQAQHDKLKEVEERLEKGVRQDKEKFLQEKKAVEIKLREKEMEIKRLKQRQAIQAKNENKIAHYKRLQNFIQTETKPPIFFLPARLTLRGMELLKQSSRNLDTLIKERQTEMETELRELEELSDGEIGPAIRSLVKVVSHDKDSRAHLKPINGDDNMDEPLDDEDDDDDDLNQVFKVRSSVVVPKSDIKKADSEDKVTEEKMKNNEKKESADEKDDSKESSRNEEAMELEPKDDKEESKPNGDKESSKDGKKESHSKSDKEKPKSDGNKEESSKADKKESKSRGDKEESKRDRRESRGDKEESKSHRKESRDNKDGSKDDGKESRGDKDGSKHERKESRSDKGKSNGDKEESRSDRKESKSRSDKDETRSKDDKEKARANGDKDDSKSKGREEGKKVSSKKHGSASPSD
uniref:Pinin/SDK/MemA protein domain-containing protein n=1 Tax=Panagrolaimus davidi TaxID=227884 RepID=A0A914QWL5_9BILA